MGASSSSRHPMVPNSEAEANIGEPNLTQPAQVSSKSPLEGVRQITGSQSALEGARQSIGSGSQSRVSEPDEVITVWDIETFAPKNSVNEEDPVLDISAKASVNIQTNSKKKKGSYCFCCKSRRKKGYKGKGGFMVDRDLDSPTEVISLNSFEDLVLEIEPSKAFPIEMVASIRPSDTNNIVFRKRRTRVPEKPDKPMSLWSIIKSYIGKDLTKTPLPVNFSEPLSMIQRLAEDYEFSSILDTASNASDSLEQLALVAVFTISSYASTAVRTAKPFNPLLGETYEFNRMDDMGWRYIAEQVCHHPPVAALHCESINGWVSWQQFTMNSKFRGNYLEIVPLGIAHLRFKTTDNHYTWRKVTTVIRNLILGKLYIEQDGEMEIINHTTNEKCKLKYSSGGMFSRDRSVTGKVYNSANVPKWDIHGAWDTEVSITKLDSNCKPIMEEKRVVWKNYAMPPDAEKFYNFSVFASQLNEMEDGPAPTDSRFRTDQRLMENGLWDEANVEKQRLEERQRVARAQRQLEAATRLSTASQINGKGQVGGEKVTVEEGVEPYYCPCWFEKQRDPVSGLIIHMFNSVYWQSKKLKSWGPCPNLYDR